LADFGAAVIPAIAGSSAGVGASNPVLKAVGKKGEAIGKALATNPKGTLGNTATSVPETLNALISGIGRTALETAAEGVAARTHSSEVFGVKPGPPGEALKSMGTSIAHDYKERYGKSVEQDQKRMEKQGILPEALDVTSVFGGGAAASGRLASKAVEAGGMGAADYAKVVAHRDAVQHAFQAPDVKTFVERGKKIPPAPTRLEHLKAGIYESTQQRPNLRQAPGAEPMSKKRGAAVVEQTRSPNLFRASGQTAVDNARRARDQATLRRVMDARKAAEENPALAGELIPKSHASQLAFDARRGEVTPLLQRGGLAKNTFVGAEKAQRIGAAYGKGENVRERRGIVDAATQTTREVLKDATPEQRKLIVFAKEGHLPLNSPKAGVRWLQEIHDQAVAGHDQMRIPIQHVKEGASVARETGSVLAHIKKNGAESVFTPEFAQLVEHLPDERLVSPKNPLLNPDTAIARKYLPQQHMLGQWAERNPKHPDARATAAAVEQIHHLLEEGLHLRQEAALTGSKELHDKATDKFATAKNLADENARAHGLPTDRAYVQHTQSLGKDDWLHTVANTSPADYKRWRGILQKAGYRSTDAELVLRGYAKSVRDIYSVKNVNDFEKRFAVKLPRKDMTGREAHRWLADSGRNPKDFEVVHLGKLRHDMADLSEAEHLVHLNSDPEAHARSLQRMWEHASVGTTDSTKGASVIPKGAFEEMKSSFGRPGAISRSFGKAKGQISKLMLGTSVPWLTTMSTFTYPIQSIMGGAGPIDFASHVKYYKALSPGDKAAFDQAYGVDNPFRISSHGTEAERMGSQLPQSLEGLARTLKVAKASPMGRFFRRLNPVRAIIGAERIPRRYARINVATKGLKNAALKKMVEEMRGSQVAQDSFELKVQKLLHTGRLPAKQYMDKAVASTKDVEKIAQHAINAMGEWHNMTQFERNHVNRYVMFYPWLRYSLKLAAHTLPANHPLLYAAALKLGTWEHRNLVELLGTEPAKGNVYLGKAQPNVRPEKRQWSDLNIKQANPVLNTAIEAIAGKPSELLNVLPPYLASALEWATNKNLFTDKPLKGSKYGESKASKESPSLVPFMVEHNLVQPFGLARTAEKLKTGGRPQSAESVPLIPGMEKPVQYPPGVERLIRREEKEQRKEPLGFKLLREEIPLIPHKDETLASKIRAEEKEAKESKRNARREQARKRKPTRLKREPGELPTIETSGGTAELPTINVGP
jgi:hypothetical protein